MVIAQRLSHTNMRSAIAASLLMCLLVLVPATAEPSVSTMSASGDDPKQPNEGNTTMRIYSDGAECWAHFNDNDTESRNDPEDEPYLEEYRKSGTLDIDIWCAMEPELDIAFLLEEDGAFGGNIQIELGGHWSNGQDGCAGSNNGNCENLNISLYRENAEFFRDEITSVSDGMNNIPINAPVNPDFLTFDGSSECPKIRFEMVIIGDYQDGGWFTGPTGEEALFRLYLGNNSTVEWPIDAASFQEGFELDEGGSAEGGDTPGFTTVLAMAAVTAGAIALKRKPE